MRVYSWMSFLTSRLSNSVKEIGYFSEILSHRMKEFLTHGRMTKEPDVHPPAREGLFRRVALTHPLTTAPLAAIVLILVTTRV